MRALPTGTALPAVGPGIPTILALERQPLTLGRVHRTTFTRQAANLGAVKAQLRQQLLGQVGFDPAISILDSFPMPVCRFGRADRCRRLAELASFGRDEGAKQTYYGLRAHLRVCWPGVITDGHLAPANLHDLALADDLVADAHSWALGDRAYWSPVRAGLLAGQTVAATASWDRWSLLAVVVELESRPSGGYRSHRRWGRAGSTWINRLPAPGHPWLAEPPASNPATPGRDERCTPQECRRGSP